MAECKRVLLSRSRVRSRRELVSGGGAGRLGATRGSASSTAVQLLPLALVPEYEAAGAREGEAGEDAVGWESEWGEATKGGWLAEGPDTERATRGPPSASGGAGGGRLGWKLPAPAPYGLLPGR